MQLAGVPVLDRDVFNLVVALTIDDREHLLRVLEDGPDEYAELRDVLLREHVWRVEHGL